MPYLPVKDELISFNRLSSRGLWKWYNSKILVRRLYGGGEHFTFCRFSRKRKFVGNFHCDFRKCFTKGFFSDWIWRISKFPVLTANIRPCHGFRRHLDEWANAGEITHSTEIIPDIRFSYKHCTCNFSRVCLLVKMASKTVTRSIPDIYRQVSLV